MSGAQHLGWEALERVRTDEASATEYAHLAKCAACREALADLERLASRFKESLGAEADAIPAAREDAILGAARERAAAIAGKKLVRIPWWKQRSTMALAASLMVAGSAVYLTYLKGDEPSPRPVATPATRNEVEQRAEDQTTPHVANFRSPTSARTHQEAAQKKEAARLDDRPSGEPQELQKSLPSPATQPSAMPAESPAAAAKPKVGVDLLERKGDEAASKDANLAPRDFASAAPAKRAPVPEPAKSAPAAPPSTTADSRVRALAEQAPAPAGSALGGAAAGVAGPVPQAPAPPPPAAAEDKLVGALSAEDAEAERRIGWLPPRTGLWVRGQGEERDLLQPQPLPLVSTEIEVRVGDTIARRVRQRFANPSGQPIVATYSIGLAPGESGNQLSLTIGNTDVPPHVAEEMTHVRVWQDLPIAGATIDLTTLSPPRPLEGVATGTVRLRIPVPPPPPQATDAPPKLAIRLEPAQGFRIGQPAAAGLAIKGHPLGSGAWDLTLPPTLGVKEDLLELDVPIVKSGG